MVAIGEGVEVKVYIDMMVKVSRGALVEGEAGDIGRRTAHPEGCIATGSLPKP